MIIILMASALLGLLFSIFTNDINYYYSYAQITPIKNITSTN